MIRNYPLSLRVDLDAGSYSLVLGADSVIASVTPDEPMDAMSALRALLGIKAES